MVLTSGHYRTLVGNHSLTVPQESNTLTLASSDSVTPISLRRNKDSWLSLDDGKLGKYGNPTQVRARVQGSEYRIWVEQRGPEQFGLIPCQSDGEYSNRFLGVEQVDGQPAFVIKSSWLPECRFAVSPVSS